MERPCIQGERERIKGFGVKRTGLFGSYVREERRRDSAIEALAEFEHGIKTSKNYTGLGGSSDILNKSV